MGFVFNFRDGCWGKSNNYLNYTPGNVSPDKSSRYFLFGHGTSLDNLKYMLSFATVILDSHKVSRYFIDRWDNNN